MTTSQDDFDRKLKDTEEKLKAIRNNHPLLEMPNSKSSRIVTVPTKTIEPVTVDAKEKLKEINRKATSTLPPPPPPPDFEERTVEKTRKKIPDLTTVNKILKDIPPLTPLKEPDEPPKNLPSASSFIFGTMSKQDVKANIPDYFQKKYEEETVQKPVTSQPPAPAPVHVPVPVQVQVQDEPAHDVLNPVNPYTEAFGNRNEKKPEKICCFTMHTFLYIITFMLFLSNIIAIAFAGVVYIKYNELNTYVNNINQKLSLAPSLLAGSDGSTVNEAIIKINQLDSQLSTLTLTQQQLLNITKNELMDYIYENYNKTTLEALNSANLFQDVALKNIMFEVKNITSSLSSNLTEHLDLVSNTVDQLVSQNLMSTNDITTLKVTTKQVFDDVGKLKTDTTGMSNNIITLTNSLSTTSNSISSLTSSTQTLNNNINSLQTTVGTINTQTLNLNTNVNSISNTLVTHATNINTVTSLAQNLQADVTTLSKNLQTNVASLSEGLQASVEILTNTNKTVSTHLKTLSSEISQLSSGYNTVSTSINQQTSVVNSIITDVSKNEEALKTVNDDVKKNQSQINLILQTFLSAFEALKSNQN